MRKLWVVCLREPRESNELLQCIQKEQAATEVAMAQYLSGQTWYAKRQCERYERILDATKSFDRTKILEFLDIMSVILSADKEVLSEDQLEHMGEIFSEVLGIIN